MLLTGAAGLGKRVLAEQLIRSLLCPERDEQGFACGRCGDCALLAAGSHPDRVEVGPDGDAKSPEIKVDAIRKLASIGALTAHRGGWKLFLVDPAHRMNPSASNALLKTLEEPAPSTLICLISEYPARLAATIRSRCQVLRVPTPAEADALDWLRPRIQVGEAGTLLRLAYGAPLRAIELADAEQLSRRDRLFEGFAETGMGRRDPIAEAAAWKTVPPEILLDWLGGWVSDLMRLSVGHPAPRLINMDKVDVLSALARRLHGTAGHRFLRSIWSARAADVGNLNVQLLYEALLVEWARSMRTRSD